MYRIAIFSIFLLISSCNLKKNTRTTEQEHIAAAKSYDKIDELPIAVLYDTSMELDFMQVANKMQTEFKVSEVIITSDTWATTFNKMGNITAQSRTASIIAIRGGKCYIQDIVLEQKRNGKTYGEIKIASKNNWKIFDCNLQKNNNPDDIVGVINFKN